MATLLCSSRATKRLQHLHEMHALLGKISSWPFGVRTDRLYPDGLQGKLDTAEMLHNLFLPLSDPA